MRFVSVRDLRGRAGSVLSGLTDELVLTSHGSPIALVTPVDGDSLDFALRAQRQARAMLAVAELRTSAARQGLDRLSDEEINKEIAAARRERAPRR